MSVESIGVIPSGAAAMVVLEKRACAGVILSASHNPASDNGVKFCGSDGAKLTEDSEKEIERGLDRTKPAPESTAVRQNHVEESVVDPVASLAELVKVSRGIEFSTRLMQQQDQITGRLIDTFGRFA